jgi:transcriptional regulator with XRE-family HTH domain
MKETQPFGAVLKRYRRRAFLTQEELAARARLSVRAIADIERGIIRQPRVRTVKMLADALGLEGNARHIFLDAAQNGHGTDLVDEYGSPSMPTLVEHTHRDDYEAGQLQTYKTPSDINQLHDEEILSYQKYLAAYTSKYRQTTHRTRWLRPIFAAILVIVAFLVSSFVLSSGVLSPQNSPTLRYLEGGYFAPMNVTSRGQPFIETGKQVTATFRVKNTGTNEVILEMMAITVRGPEACKDGWDADHADFPSVQGIVLKPGAEYVYQGSRTFNRPGVYFAQSVLISEDRNAISEGTKPKERLWFSVAIPNSEQIPDANCSNSIPPVDPFMMRTPNTSRPFIKAPDSNEFSNIIRYFEGGVISRVAADVSGL